MKNIGHRHTHNVLALLSGLALALASPLQAATVNQVAKFSNAGGQVTDSSISDSGGNVNVAANLLLGGTTNYLGLKRSSDGVTRAVVFNGAVLGGADTDFLEFGALPNGFKFLDTSNNPLLTILNNGNVGLGTATPNRRLMVVTSGTAEAIRAEAPTGVNALTIGTGILSVDAPGIQNGRFIVNDSGNVGIGVANPNRRLTVFTSDATEGIRVDVPTGVNALAIGTGTVSVDSPGVQGGRVVVKDNGFLGLNDPNPGTRLWVNGEATVTGSIGDVRFAPRSGSGTTMFLYNPNGTDLRVSGYFPDLVTFLSTGNVGFGTTTPKATISVAGGIGPGGQIGLLGNAGSAANRPGLYFGTNTSFNGTGATAYFGLTAAPAGHESDFALVGSSDPNTHRNLLIGYNTSDDPSQTFNAKVTIDTYTGNITTTGTITGAVYQDLAEWVPAAETLLPGTVVVLNPEKKNEVIASSEAYDTTVAGVVSEHPGIVLGKSGADKAQVATTGRVKVKVDARRAAIRIGDLLVTSDVSGTAMKSEPMEINGRRFHQPGTIVGKALEPLESGTGEILVLLSLQ